MGGFRYLSNILSELSRRYNESRWREPVMVHISAGTFLMGSSPSERGHSQSESPKRKVIIERDFEIGKYPVTFREWDIARNIGFDGPPLDDQGWGRGLRPVINISYNEVLCYIDWLNHHTGKFYRLPSEAEWEYACRSGTTSRYSFGDEISPELARYKSKGPIRVDSFPPNHWGIVGMHGNTFEWCEDCWNENYVGAPTTGTPWLSGNCNERIWRGGAWGGSADWLRSATRFHYEKDFRYCDGGFRLAKTV